jgi:hypothetical protein
VPLSADGAVQVHLSAVAHLVVDVVGFVGEVE